MNRTIGILAHVDAGKTTLSEQILYHTQTIRSRGRVDHKTAFLDCHPLEKQRGITIFSDQAVFQLNETDYFLIDTPGHADFSAEMERAVQVLDTAVIVISAVEGIQGHTETVWRLLRRYNVPTFFFLNKTDREGANMQGVAAQLSHRFSSDICLLEREFAAGRLEQAAAEQVAGLDEGLFEQYLDTGVDFKQWLQVMRRLVARAELFPCMTGSALNDDGVREFLACLDLLSSPLDKDGPFAGRVYKIRRDAQNNRLAFVKVSSGVLQVKDLVAVCGGQAKVNEIRLYNGAKFQPVKQVEAGGLCAVTGLDTVHPGDGIGEESSPMQPFCAPALTARVLFDQQVSPYDVLGCFRVLEDEDPLLGVQWNESLQQLQIAVMGMIQLEILQLVVKQRFDFDISFGECEVLYKETIASSVVGYGHFEPLRHYAEVHLRLAPGERGSGLVFDSECPTDLLNGSFQRLVRTHLFEKEHRGVLTGSPLTDVRVTLLAGRAHLKHTEGGDFREATYRAVRQGLEQAQSVLLEPYYAFSIETPAEQMGRVLSDIQRMCGSFDPPELGDGRAVITGRGPVSEFLNYSRELVSFTRGAGTIVYRADGYEPCHNPEQTAACIQYDKIRDMENTSDSIFCAHGAGFAVKWNEVANYIHCK